jgi:transcriptional regulator GlxA family with amidase domain
MNEKNFCKAAKEEPTARGVCHTDYVQKAVAYISANYSRPITVEEIAGYVGLSRSHLFRSFEKVMDKSPKEYLTDFRIRRACNLLQGSDLSITAIANAVGFENSLYFSKVFHRATGMSPKNYRAAAQGEKKETTAP